MDRSMRIAEHLHDIGALLDEPFAGGQHCGGVFGDCRYEDIRPRLAQRILGHGEDSAAVVQDNGIPQPAGVE